MYCRICPAYPLVEAIVEMSTGRVHPRLKEAMLKWDELSKKCIACHLKAKKNAYHLGPDRDSGKLHHEITLDEAAFTLHAGDRNYATAKEYINQLLRDTSTGCTAELTPEVEDLLRKAASVVVDAVEVKDAHVLLALLKREPLASARPKKLERREFVASVHRVLRTLDRAKSIIKYGDARLELSDKPTREQTRQAAAKLIGKLCSSLTAFDAPILLGMMQGLTLADTARAAGLKNRATAHARARSMLERMPQLKPLHSTAKD